MLQGNNDTGNITGKQDSAADIVCERHFLEVLCNKQEVLSCIRSYIKYHLLIYLFIQAKMKQTSSSDKRTNNDRYTENSGTLLSNKEVH